MASDGPVKLPAHLRKPTGGTDQCRLRRRKGLAVVQCPAEMVWVDAHHKPAAFKLAGFCCRFKIAAVQKHGAVAQACILPGISVAQYDKGIVLMAGGAPDTAYALDAGMQSSPVQAAFHEMMAVKGNEIQVGAYKVQTERYI